MITMRIVRPVCVLLAVLMDLPSGFAQQKPPSADSSAPLSISVLEGDNSVNSVSLLRSVAPVVEVRDENDFPLEGAVVVFTLEDQSLGSFATGGNTFTTRSDSHGQASGPYLVPKASGKIRIAVSATLGARKADLVINQTNAASAYFGPPLPKKPFYKRKMPIILMAAGVAGAVVAIVLLTGGSSSSTVAVTPGTPVFH